MKSTTATTLASALILTVTSCAGELSPEEEEAAAAHPEDEAWPPPPEENLEPDEDFDLGDEELVTDEELDELEKLRVYVYGPRVLRRVKRFANVACRLLGACHVSTYWGHPPATNRALDFLVSSGWGRYPYSYRLGNRVARLALRRARRYRVSYVIWRQRINYADGRGWFWMANRGSVTQNHYDHVHVGFRR